MLSAVAAPESAGRVLGTVKVDLVDRCCFYLRGYNSAYLICKLLHKRKD